MSVRPFRGASMRDDYFTLLPSTASEHAVVQLAKSYLASWTPAELAAIPASVRPGGLGDAEDLADTAYALTKARIASPGSNRLLEEMEQFFARASARISELESAPRRVAGKSYLTR
jgi:hypothetical protein